MCFYSPPWLNKRFYKNRARANTKVTEAKQEVTKLLRDLTALPSPPSCLPLGFSFFFRNRELQLPLNTINPVKNDLRAIAD